MKVGFLGSLPKMELHKDLQSLIERASNLHHRFNEEIKSSVSFCNHCSEHGWFCRIEDTPFEERDRLIACRDLLKELEDIIACRDLLKELEDILICLQRLRSWQLINRQAALNHLEESRLILTEKVSKYQGRPLDVIKELNECFGDNEISFDWNKKIGQSFQYGERQRNSFLHCCIRFICSPATWQKAIGTAAKLIVISISVSSSVHLYRTRQKQNCSSSRNVVECMEFIKEGRAERKLIVSKSHLNVSQGKG